MFISYIKYLSKIYKWILMFTYKLNEKSLFPKITVITAMRYLQHQRLQSDDVVVSPTSLESSSFSVVYHERRIIELKATWNRYAMMDVLCIY